MLYAGLLSAADLLEAPVPGDVLHKINGDGSVQKVIANEMAAFRRNSGTVGHMAALRACPNERTL